MTLGQLALFATAYLLAGGMIAAHYHRNIPHNVETLIERNVAARFGHYLQLWSIITTWPIFMLLLKVGRRVLQSIENRNALNEGVLELEKMTPEDLEALAGDERDVARAPCRRARSTAQSPRRRPPPAYWRALARAHAQLAVAHVVADRFEFAGQSYRLAQHCQDVGESLAILARLRERGRRAGAPRAIPPKRRGDR